MPFFAVFFLVGVMPFCFTDAQVPPDMPETFLGYGMMGVTFDGRTFSGHCKFSVIVIAIDETLACINSSICFLINECVLFQYLVSKFSLLTFIYPLCFHFLT